MSKVAIIGDIGGHVDELYAELDRLGCDPRAVSIPHGMKIIQVGDLIHKGPQSEAVVALVGRLMTENEGQWIQLAGNHEAQYLREPTFKWHQTITKRSSSEIVRWWQTGMMRVAAAVKSRDEEFLVSHAGVTNPYWEKVLESSLSAVEASSRLNSMVNSDDDTLFKTGQMMGEGAPDLDAGPLWASAGNELIASWADRRRMPFSQVHGHSTVMNWQTGAVAAGFEFADLMVYDWKVAHEIATLPDGSRIIGVDPGHDQQPHQPWRSLVLADADIVESA